MRAYRPALNALGLIIMIFGLLMGFPLGVSLWLDDGAALAYDKAILVTVAAGLALWLATRGVRRDLRVHDGFFLVVATWVILPLFGALPLMGYMPALGFTDAYFEAVSGLTATGATVLSGVDDLPISINVWRTQMHWIGGMGIIVLVVAVGQARRMTRLRRAHLSEPSNARLSATVQRVGRAAVVLRALLGLLSVVAVSLAALLL